MTVHPFGTIEGETTSAPLHLPRLMPRLLPLVRRAAVPVLCLAAGFAGLAGIALARLG